MAENEDIISKKMTDYLFIVVLSYGFSARCAWRLIPSFPTSVVINGCTPTVASRSSVRTVARHSARWHLSANISDSVRGFCAMVHASRFQECRMWSRRQWLARLPQPQLCLPTWTCMAQVPGHHFRFTRHPSDQVSRCFHQGTLWQLGYIPLWWTMISCLPHYRPRRHLHQGQVCQIRQAQRSNQKEAMVL